MYPIFGLAAAVLLVAMFKWIGLSMTRKPSKKRIAMLLDSIAKHDESLIAENVKAIKGPVGKMLSCGVEHIKEPRDLIEEVMYEKVMDTRLKLERFLPFISISAASAPLLGLLGTVTGIINTFKLLTVFGSGDVKALSGGISEALVTTKWGLIVAIPALLLHALLSRKARGMINAMEKAAVSFINQISKTPFHQNGSSNTINNLSANQAQAILQKPGNEQTLEEAEPEPAQKYPADSAYTLMKSDILSIKKSATVSEAIDVIRKAGIKGDINSVFVVDDQGKYEGNVLIRHLLTRPEDMGIDSLTEMRSVFIRADAHRNNVNNMFFENALDALPVLDHDDQLIGQIDRNGYGD